jgi:GNAT superfamily N-acetyltransferase
MSAVRPKVFPQIFSFVYFLMYCFSIFVSVRLTWQHTQEKAIRFSGSVQPQTMHGWLTLYWEKNEMMKFLFNSKSSQVPIKEKSDVNCVKPSAQDPSSLDPSYREAIITCLNSNYSMLVSTSYDNIIVRRLRLANSNDAGTIRRLVQGLADFVREPEAVCVTADHYRIDGYRSEPPLFYCVLLEVALRDCTDSVETFTKDSNHVTDLSQDWHACGMAFCWIGCTVQSEVSSNISDNGTLIHPEQPFLFLDDLFIEEQYRGDGAGTLMMRALAEITLSVNCFRMVWQALDWNTPALTFYQNKIGAQVVDGLLTTRSLVL